MPLLNKNPLCTESPPSDLKDDEELFVCRQTNEVFRDYESFFKRTILCNSLVWSCEITLKHGLTYEEAVESEQEAKKIVKQVPQPIKRGIITLVHYTRHSRLDNLCDEVFYYIRDRYQEGEEIEVKYKGQKLVGCIHSVIEPKAVTNGFDSPKSKNKLNSPKPGKSSQSQVDVIVLSDEEGQSERPAIKSSNTSKNNPSWPDANSYEYMVKLKPSKNSSNTKTSEIITVKQPCISRKKGVFSREKLRLLLRLACYRAGQGNGYWKVKDEFREMFDLSADVDDANIAVVKTSKKRKREEVSNIDKKKKTKKIDDKKSTGLGSKEKMDDKTKGEKPKLTQEEIQRIKEDFKLEREKEKELRKQERDKARLKRSELLKEQKMFLLHWCVPQDDLDLNDNKELPKPVPVESKFSSDMFGDVIMVLEFLYVFGEFFSIKQDFPDGITLDILEEALTEHDAEGSFYDIIRFLLSSILTTHAEEEEDEGLDDIDHKDNVTNTEDEDDNDMTRVKKAVSVSAAMAAAWAQVHQGKNLHELTLDPFTCSEILRLHFLSSGASLVSGADGDPYRWQRRGGFTFSDDAGVSFRHHEHTIMRTLVTGNVYDLNATEKLKILKTLCAQLLTYATTRDIIDDGFDRLRKAKREWQEEQWADQRKDKEEAAAKYRKRMEDKAKEKEEKNKLNEQGKTDETKVDERAKTESTPTLDGNEEAKAHTRSQGPVVEEQAPGAEDQAEAERIERKENLKRKGKVFLKEIRKSQSMSGIQPIGTDRLFRRYWMFHSLSGLFIEDNDPYLPKLLQLEENGVEVGDDDSNSDTTSESTEEDLPGPSTTSVVPQHKANIKSLSKEQIERERDLCRILKLYNIPQESVPVNCVLNTGESSLKREQICARIRNRQVTQWSYMDKKEDLDLLLKSLNPRGRREKYLRESLVESYDLIVKGLENNPFKMENKQRREGMKHVPKESRNQTVDKSLYKTMEDFIEASVRDQILDLEDRIWQGGLGVLKVDDIITWRKQVENGIYDFLPGHRNNSVLENSEKGNQNNGVSDSMDIDQGSTNNVTTTETMDTDEPPVNITNDLKLKLLSNVDDSRPGTPLEGSFLSTPTTSQTPQAINPCVRILAKAVLELEQGIERKYLIPPLGEDDETKKRRQQETADAAKRELNDMMAKKKKEKVGQTNDDEKQQNEKNEEKPKAKAQKSLLKRWEDSLMTCTNLAQVSIHLSNLDNCISWDKSVLNARCRICRRKGDAEHMLLCDGCDKGHHMYCIKPPIKQIPDGDWFCSQCRPVEPRRSIRRQKRKEDSDNDDDGERQDFKLLEIDGQEEEESEDESDEDEDSHAESENDDSEEADESEAHSSDDDGSVHMETCACCDGEGELLCCETCPLVYHLECAYPPLRRIPRGSWACQVCTGADQDLPSGRRVKKSVIKAALKHVKDKQTSKHARKKAKIQTKPAQSKQKPSKIKTDKYPRKSTKRQSSGSNSPSTGRTGNAARVDETKPNTRSPKVSLAPTGLSSSPPPSRLEKWSSAITKKCEKLLNELMDQEDSWPFLAPVDHIEVPDYKTVIKTPMDFQTIKTKLSSHQYNTTDDFAADVRLVFFNCSEYNKPRTKEARAGVRLSAYFETRYGELGLDTSEQRRPRTRRSR